MNDAAPATNPDETTGALYAVAASATWAVVAEI